jgi:hypothetical protein
MILSPPRIRRVESGDGGDSTAHTMSHNISSKKGRRFDNQEEEKVPSCCHATILTTKRVRQPKKLPDDFVAHPPPRSMGGARRLIKMNENMMI